jgi:hypothetical protein
MGLESVPDAAVADAEIGGRGVFTNETWPFQGLHDIGGL